jgi:hypothetical protein
VFSSSPGPTGAQGGSVVRAILENKQFAVRALTRDVARPNAVLLKDLGAEVVRCDLNDKASVEAALKGVHGAFLVTNFWDDFSKEKEVCQVGTKLFHFSPFIFPFPLYLAFMKCMYFRYLARVSLIVKLMSCGICPMLKTLIFESNY